MKNPLTSAEMSECLNLISNAARTRMLCITEGQRRMLSVFAQIMSGEDFDQPIFAPESWR